MAKNAMSAGDGLQLDSGAVMFCDTIKYLGIHFRSGKRLQIDIDPTRRHIYAASNSIFMNASHQDLLIPLHLQECYCLSQLTYCYTVLNLSKALLSDLNVCLKNLQEAFSFSSVGICLCIY